LTLRLCKLREKLRRLLLPRTLTLIRLRQHPARSFSNILRNLVRSTRFRQPMPGSTECSRSLRLTPKLRHNIPLEVINDLPGRSINRRTKLRIRLW
jgi:hypothetical protein